MKFEWETIYYESCETAHEGTRRSKVFGGWVVKNLISNGKGHSQSSVFIPDQNHEWVIE